LGRNDGKARKRSGVFFTDYAAGGGRNIERQSSLFKQIASPGGDIFLEPLLGVQNVPDSHENVLDCHIVGDGIYVGFYVKEEEELGCKDFRRAIVCFQQRDNRSLT
jgi:hypothetical protein